MRLRKLLLTLAIGVIFLGACAAPSTPPAETPPTPPAPPAETPSPVTQNLSAQIAGIDITETTALTSLRRISNELDEARNDGSLSEEEQAELRTDLMEKFNNWVNQREDLLDLSGLNLLPAQEQIAWTEQESALLEGAAERIEQYRKGGATVLVVDRVGAPVADAVVHIDMLKHDFLFGANLFMLNRAGSLNQAYGDAFAKLFNYATLPFYWPSYERVQGSREKQEKLTNMALWASEHGITTKGHPLIWPVIGVPDWAERFSPEQLDEVQHERVTRIIEHFRGLIDCWDVVNEPTHVDGYQEPLKSWMQAHTPAGATALALEWARASNQEATLLVNDWRNDDEYHAILEDVLASGAQFDVIGLQSHMHVGRRTLEEVWDTCERFKDFNLPLHFTEVTVLSGHLKTDDDWFSYHPGWDTTPEGEAIQAEYVPALYTILFSHPSVQAITWWDLSDLEAWQGAPAGLIRKDMSPKPAYKRLMQLINREWWTNADAKTNEQGEAIILGFYGQYLLTVKSETRSVQKLIHLKTDHENVFEVQLP